MGASRHLYEWEVGSRGLLELRQNIWIWNESDIGTEFRGVALGAFFSNAAATGTEGKVVSAFGFSMQRSDETVRANSSGKGGLMIFSAQLDTFLANAKQSNLQEDAPISTSGF